MRMYHVFARKYRPKNFNQLIGQDPFVQTLTNALSLSRVAHAYILTGVRGVGKTTGARIIARALNCIGSDGSRDQPSSEPCQRCFHCTMIDEGRHPDVYEMDAASHTGIANIQELLASVPYAPASARFKIYIIDEIHMLSEKAFNALLKTLEEPPEHIKFIFATTEIRKVPVTIISRCQQFVFRRVAIKLLATYLEEICHKEGLHIESEAATLLAYAAEGSVRDALSLLDQAAVSSEGQTISKDVIVWMLALTDRNRLFDLLEACLEGEAQKALALSHSLYASAAEPLRLLQDLLGCLYTLTYYRIGNCEDVPPLDQERLKALSQRLSIADLTRAWQIILKGLEETQKAPNWEQAVDMVLIRLAFASSLPTPLEIIDRLQTPNVSTTTEPLPAEEPSRSDNPVVQEILKTFPGSYLKE